MSSNWHSSLQMYSVEPVFCRVRSPVVLLMAIKMVVRVLPGCRDQCLHIICCPFRFHIFQWAELLIAIKPERATLRLHGAATLCRYWYLIMVSGGIKHRVSSTLLVSENFFFFLPIYLLCYTLICTEAKDANKWRVRFAFLFFFFLLCSGACFNLQLLSLPALSLHQTSPLSSCERATSGPPPIDVTWSVRDKTGFSSPHVRFKMLDHLLK